jgi:hypothetical protein
MSIRSPLEPDVRGLIHEVRRYLVAVDAFRREGCEPRWLPERGRQDARRPRSRHPAVGLDPECLDWHP